MTKMSTVAVSVKSVTSVGDCSFSSGTEPGMPPRPTRVGRRHGDRLQRREEDAPDEADQETGAELRQRQTQHVRRRLVER